MSSARAGLATFKQVRYTLSCLRLTVRKLALDLFHRIQSRHKSVYTYGVEVLTALAFQVCNALFNGPGVLIWPLAHQGVEDVSDCDDPGDDRYVFAVKAVWIA